MSHFPVMVFGEDWEKQLAPYHEFECTGVDDEYVQDVDITPDVRKRMADGEELLDALSYYGLEEKIVGDESQLNKAGQHKYGYAVVLGKELVKAAKRTNPNDKWDYWRVGGRWSGHMMVYPGVTPKIITASGEYAAKLIMARRSDQARKREIDLAGLADAEADEAAARWDAIAEAFGGEIPQIAIPWKTLLDDPAYAGVGMDRRREIYHGQPAKQRECEVRKASKGNELVTWFELENYQGSRAAYLAEARASAFPTLAVVKDGKWHERGEVGWWATISNEKPEEDWLKEFWGLFESAPGDCLITVVDCHI
jgi:hypothetical protein